MTNERDSNLSGCVDTLPECASGEARVALTFLLAAASVAALRVKQLSERVCLVAYFHACRKQFSSRPSRKSAKPHARATRPALKLTMVEAPESQVLCGIKHLLNVHPAVAWWTRVNSGKGYLLRVDYEVIKALIATGIIKQSQVTWIEFGAPGMSDTIFQLKRRYGGTFGAVEAKKRSGRVRDDQLAFIERVNEAGGTAGIARAVDEAQRIIERGIVEMAL
jgi:hypothetical protein